MVIQLGLQTMRGLVFWGLVFWLLLVFFCFFGLFLLSVFLLQYIEYRLSHLWLYEGQRFRAETEDTKYT